MPFNGTGTFVPVAFPDYPAVSGSLILASSFNTNMLDLFNGLSNCLTRDGQSPPSANLPMAGAKHTGVGAAVADTDYAQYGQVKASAVQTLTNKSIDLTNNTLTGTKVQFNTACSDADFATIAGTETLTNKTALAATNIVEARSAPGTSQFSHRNKLYNPDFRVNQRVYVSGAAVGAGLYGHDRWKMAAAGDTYTFATVANKTTVTIPAGKVLRQVVEGLNLQTGTYVLSWEGTAQGKIGAGALAASGVTGAITGGVDTTIEFAGPGTVANLQLEVGSIATPFEHRAYGEELVLCQRYAEPGTARIDAYINSAGFGLNYRHAFKVTKRAVPTVSYGATVTSNVTIFDARDATTDSVLWYCTATAPGNCVWDGTWFAVAEL